MSCPTCEEIHCLEQIDTMLYSLEGDIYPFVLNCPPGYDCNDSSLFSVVCCGEQLTTVFPPGSTADQKVALITDLMNRCANRQKYCNEFPPQDPDNPTDNSNYFYNRTKQCYATCPDGSKFYYTVLPGTFAALTQDIADSQAQSYACQQAAAQKMCLSNINGKACANSPYSQKITVTGGIGPKTFQIVAGVLPTGTDIDNTGKISGTPTVGAEYVFTVRVQSTINGSYTLKDYSICVYDISPSGATLSLAEVGTPVLYTFSTTSCAVAPLSWQLAGGSLPPGTVLDEETGKITGTPTLAGTYNFTIKVQDSST